MPSKKANIADFLGLNKAQTIATECPESENLPIQEVLTQEDLDNYGYLLEQEKQSDE